MAGKAARLKHVFRWLAVAVFVLASLQPVLGAFGFFRVADDLDYTAMHEMIAMILVLLVLLLFVLTFFTGFQHRHRMLGWTGALLITVLSEIVLGYASSDDVTQLAWHIPLGVAVTIFALVIVLLAYGLTLNRPAA